MINLIELGKITINLMKRYVNYFNSYYIIIFDKNILNTDLGFCFCLFVALDVSLWLMDSPPCSLNLIVYKLIITNRKVYI